MEVILDVKGVSKIMNPTQDSVIAFDGKQWYLTSKESLLEDSYKLIEEARQELEKIKAENQEFRQKVAKQLFDMSELIKKLYEVKE